MIHTALQNFEGVSTSSTGTEPNRRVVISMSAAPPGTTTAAARRARVELKTAEVTGMIYETVRELLAHQLEIGPGPDRAADRHLEDLGADSLDIVELVMAIEEEYDIVITDERAANVRTVEQLVEMLEGILGSK